MLVQQACTKICGVIFFYFTPSKTFTSFKALHFSSFHFMSTQSKTIRLLGVVGVFTPHTDDIFSTLFHTCYQYQVPPDILSTLKLEQIRLPTLKFGYLCRSLYNKRKIEALFSVGHSVTENVIALVIVPLTKVLFCTWNIHSLPQALMLRTPLQWNPIYPCFCGTEYHFTLMGTFPLLFCSSCTRLYYTSC